MMYDQAIANELESLITKAVKARLQKQGHVATGKGLNSIETRVKERGQGLVIEILGEDYLAYQETGRKAGTLPNIGALEKWVKQKRLASEAKEVKRIAWAIGINMKRIGMHSNNKRLDTSKRKFLSSTIEGGTQIIQGKLFEMFEKNFALMVTQFTKDAVTKTDIHV